MRFTLPRKAFREAMLAVFFLMSFSILKYVPGLEMIKELWVVGIFIFMVTIFVVDRVKSGLRITQFEGYILLLLIWAPISSAIQSRSEFGQPMIYGLLAQRKMVLAASAIILLYFLRHNRISLSDVEYSLIRLAWACLAIFSFATMVLDPSQFSDAGEGFVGGGNVEAASFKFNSAFILFGGFYYLFNGYWRRSTKQVFLALPFFLYVILVDGGRTQLLSVSCTLLFFIYRWASVGRLAKLLPRTLLFVAVMFVAILALKQDYLVGLSIKFEEAFTSVLTGKETADASANARVSETLIALPYIKKHWAFGNGHLSSQWNRGYESTLGYFYPSDIGVIGAVFLFGIIGVLLFSIQFLLAARYANRLPKYGGEHGALINAVKGFLLYYSIASLVTGGFVHSVEICLLFIAVLYWAALAERNTKFADSTNLPTNGAVQ